MQVGKRGEAKDLIAALEEHTATCAGQLGKEAEGLGLIGRDGQVGALELEDLRMVLEQRLGQHAGLGGGVLDDARGYLDVGEQRGGVGLHGDDVVWCDDLVM